MSYSLRTLPKLLIKARVILLLCPIRLELILLPFQEFLLPSRCRLVQYRLGPPYTEPPRTSGFGGVAHDVMWLWLAARFRPGGAPIPIF